MGNEPPAAVKLRMSLWAVGTAVLGLIAIVGIASLPGVSLLGAVVVATVVRTAVALAGIWVPVHRRRRPDGPTTRPAGDRSPRNPHPPSLHRARRRPLPGT